MKIVTAVKTVFWIGFLSMLVLIGTSTVMLHDENKHLEWCNEQLKLNYDSIEQCIEDEQGTVEECFLADKLEIDALYDIYGCG